MGGQNGRDADGFRQQARSGPRWYATRRHGTTQALIVLLIYLGVAGVILGVLDWRHTEPSVPADAAEAAAMAVPIGATTP